MVEVVWIALVLILEVVEEVEQAKVKCCCRTIDRCRITAFVEELNVFEKDSTATAVTDNKTVNTRYIEHHEVMEGGGGGADFTNAVLKLDNKTSGSKGGITEERPVPHLRYVSIDNVQEVLNIPESCGAVRLCDTKADSPYKPVAPQHS